jgi:hypothetical protein
MSVDFSKDRPDFCLPALGVNIEATIASNASGTFPEDARFEVALPDDLNRFNFLSIIRLSNSLISKYRKYIESYSKLDHVLGRPFVIAIANFDQPNSFLACQRPIEAVLHSYYVDEERYLTSGRKGGVLTAATLERVFKNNGSPIELGMFTTTAYREISAVIFSGCATWGKVRALSSDPASGIFFTALRSNSASDMPHVIQSEKQNYEENLFDGLRIYHNPHAAYPIDPALFRHPSVFQSYYSDDCWLYEGDDRQLLFRCVETRLPVVATSPP